MVYSISAEKNIKFSSGIKVAQGTYVDVMFDVMGGEGDRRERRGESVMRC